MSEQTPFPASRATHLPAFARASSVCLAFGLFALLITPSAVLAEGSAEFDVADVSGTHNANDQAVNRSTALRVDILNNGNESVCFVGNGRLSVYQPGGSTFIGRLNSGQCLDAVSGVTGAYELVLDSSQSVGTAWDIRVCASADRATCLTDDSKEITGRLWSRQWIFEQNSNYGQRYSINGSVYAVVSGGGPGRDAVIEMQMRGVSGAYYDLTANSTGTSTTGGVRVGRSAPESGHTSTAEFPLYLSPPAVALYNWISPQVSNVVLATGCGDVIIQDGAAGSVTFNSNVVGQYVLVCDVNKDGVYDFGSSGDFSAFGTAMVGANTANWDGKANDGSTAAEGAYNCVVRLNVGEYHYVARDIETSYPGIRMYRVEADKQTRTSISMFWDDRLVPGDNRNMNGQAGQRSPVTSPPTGLDPGAYGAAASPFYYNGGAATGNARAWGDFSAGSKGDGAYLDQFSAAATDESAPFTVRILSSTGDADNDSLTNARECALTSNPYDPDTDGDGVDDGYEATASSQPNTDGDALIDILDPDDDGDAIPTKTELGAEDGDGNPSDARNSDTDGVPDYLDLDSDNDGVGDATDVAPTDPNACRDADADNCDDCSLTGADNSGGDPSNDGVDTDGDLTCNLTDVDDDGDGVCDAAAAVANVCTAGPDSNPVSATQCADGDADGCDDCALGNGEDPANDGTDTDGDGLCDAGDVDDDGDGVLDGVDLDPLDPKVCTDSDSDMCDDCGIASAAQPGNDGIDTDGDGLCDVGDTDDDGDGVADGDDTAPTNPAVCRDVDSDTCDDCGVASAAQPGNDGTDTDGDGLCDVGDPDDDGDGVVDGDDSAPTDASRCRDLDGDTCDDCAVAFSAEPDNDGTDTDGDGLCDAGDPDDDGDGRCDAAQAVSGVCSAGPDQAKDNANICGDTDNDGCDDCALGAFDPSNDGPDADGDGQCDSPDMDGDGRCDGAVAVDGVCVAGPDSDPADERVCGDTDGDGCDDCRAGTFDPADDGPDLDGDGICDRGDDFDGDGLSDLLDLDDDGDGILDIDETLLGLDPSADTDDDGVQNYADADERGDGKANACSDDDRDGVCDTLAQAFDTDGDGVPNQHDLDSDGDTIGDADEAGHDGIDADRDGVVDGETGDNGVADAVEKPADSGTVPPPVDSDGDGTPDFLDTDSDDDRAPDAREAGDMDRVTPPVDSDGDGVADYRDSDDDDDRVPTTQERTESGADQDSDGDGTPDHLDADDDNDSVPTSDELDADGAFRDTDGDEIPDHLDADDDGDGVPTLEERDGDSDRDTDSDGIADHLDADDDDDGVPTADERRDGTDQDTDGDGIADHLDADDDGDGIPTREEPGDLDGDGTPDRLEPPLRGSLSGGALCAVRAPSGGPGNGVAISLLAALSVVMLARSARRRRRD